MLKKSEYLKFSDPKELFKLHEKDTFRLWIWGFFASLIVLLIFSIINVVIFYVYKDSIIQELINTITVSVQNLPNQPSGAAIVDRAQSVYSSFHLVVPILIMCFSAISIVVYVASILKSYKEKDFKFITKLANTLILISLIISFITYIYISSSISLRVIFSGYHILGVILTILILMVWVIFGREVGFIRNSFWALYQRNETRKQQEMLAKALRNNPELSNFLNMQNGFGGYGPFGGRGFPPQPNSQQGSPYGVPENHADAVASQESPYQVSPKNDEKTMAINKLINMSDEQLNKMAKTLNIYGYKEMPRTELVEKIYDITTTKNKDKQNRDNKE